MMAMVMRVEAGVDVLRRTLQHAKTQRRKMDRRSVASAEIWQPVWTLEPIVAGSAVPVCRLGGCGALKLR
jgi:hypothetical protein